MPITDYPRITRTPGVIGGKPRIQGTRVPAGMIASMVLRGRSHADILHDHPYLDPQDVIQAVAYAMQHPRVLKRWQ